MYREFIYAIKIFPRFLLIGSSWPQQVPWNWPCHSMPNICENHLFNSWSWITLDAKGILRKHVSNANGHNYGPSWPAHSGITASHSRTQVGSAILAAIASELKPFQMENLVVQILTKEVRKRWDSKCNTCIGTPCAVYFMWQTVFRVSC